jgi:hypothetical protein
VTGDAEPVKRLPVEWQEIDGVQIMDPDGWDRRNFEESWNTPITQAEWLDRASQSTVRLFGGAR